MKVIVLGASGFIGRNFLLQAPKNWEIVGSYNSDETFTEFIEKNKLDNVTPIKCNFLNEHDIRELFTKCDNDFDVCLYLIANLSIPKSVKQPLFDINLNTIALLNFIKSVKCKKFLFMSSGAVYSSLKGLVSPDMPPRPNIPYGISKLASEYYIRFYHERKEAFDYLNIRFFGAYGPYEVERKICTKLIKNFYFEKKNEFTVYGDGKNLIDMMYIDDAIEGLLKMIKSNRVNITIDFCKSEPMSIDNLVKTAADIFDINELAIRHEGITEEPINFYASNKSMTDLFQFTPKISLSKGLLTFAKALEEESELLEIAKHFRKNLKR